MGTPLRPSAAPFILSTLPFGRATLTHGAPLRILALYRVKGEVWQECSLIPRRPAGARQPVPGFVLVEDPVEHFPELVAVALNVDSTATRARGSARTSRASPPTQHFVQAATPVASVSYSVANDR
jgi:hypothetical protein